MTQFKTGYIDSAKDWNGWPAKVRVSEDSPIQIERSYALPIEKKTYDAQELVTLIAEKSKGLADVKVALSGTGGGQGFRDEKFLVISGWTTDLTDSEARAAKLLHFR